MKKKKENLKKKYNLHDHLHCFFCEIGPFSDKSIKKVFSFFIRGGFAEVVCEDCIGRIDKSFKPIDEL